MTDKLIPQAEVDALVAAAVLKCRQIMSTEFARFRNHPHYDRICDVSADADKKMQTIASADAQKALAAHDAALLGKAIEPMACGHPRCCEFEYTETGTEYDSSGYPVPVPIPVNGCTVCIREKKLEAENAALRQGLRKLVDVIDKNMHFEALDEARALLGDKTYRRA